MDGLADAPEAEGVEADEALTDKQWSLMFRDALKASGNYHQTKLRSQWSRNYRAFQNRHMSGSKYDSHRYRHRSKLFKPKTRMAVRKNDATAASAMFSTEDVVSITPERASDHVQAGTARFIHAALNYRLDRNGPMTGPSWFLTAIGARQDAQLTGVCVSKQYWQYEEREIPVFVDETVIDEITGEPVLDPISQLPAMERSIDYQSEVIADRLYIDLIPGEHAFVDPTGDWRDPIQTGGYFIAGFPVRKEDLEDMIEDQAARPKMGGGAWRNVDLKSVMTAKGAEQRQSEAVRRSREDGVDRYESRFSDEHGNVIWLYECFYRYGGTDWHFWMLGETIMLSDPRPVEESYPANKGERPYVRGIGTLESHKVYPTAPVELWQQLQQETNDLTNLRLDAMKMSISPITKIKRGRNVDFKQVQNRGPDAMIMVEDEDDVTFDRAPTPPSSTQLDLNNLNVDFDELAGVFSQGSVQTNRQMNETVGGMQLLASSSNSLTEFDLRVWVETWCEPVLRQCVDLIKYYETSEIVIAVAGEKAGMIKAPGPQKDTIEGPDPDEQLPEIDLAAVLGNLDTAAVSVRVNVGIGAMDSRQKLEKFMAGTKITMEMGPLLAADGIIPNGKELAQEAWGLVGYKDAGRFFRRKPEADGPPPEVQKEMAKQQGRIAELDKKGEQTQVIEQMRGMLKRLEMQQEDKHFQTEHSLEEREFEHRQRMDAMEMTMDGIRKELQGITDAVSRQGQPTR